jgi:molybdopterin converting factor small subunit
MTIRVQFFSYFKDLAGCDHAVEQLPEGARVGDLMQQVMRRFPRLRDAERCTLIAVGVDYAGRDRVLVDHEEVSLFPPVQGG